MSPGSSPPPSYLYSRDCALCSIFFPSGRRHILQSKQGKIWCKKEPIIMEFTGNTAGYHSGRDVHYYDWPYTESPKWYITAKLISTASANPCLRASSYQYSSPRSRYHYAGTWGEWNGSQYSDCSLGSPRTPLPRTPLLGKYIDIQPRSDSDCSRDKRMLYAALLPQTVSTNISSIPITRKRKGNNRYGQSGSYRCLRCQKGKRKVTTTILACFSRANLTDWTVCIRQQEG